MSTSSVAHTRDSHHFIGDEPAHAWPPVAEGLPAGTSLSDEAGPDEAGSGEAPSCRLELDDFGQQPTPTSGLPDPSPLVNNLARSVVEILAGAREIEQIARWVTDDVYRHLLKRVVLAARARSAKGSSAPRPTFAVGSVRLSEPRDGVIEAVIVIHGRVRSRAVALRLEGLDHRWRATAIHVL